MTTLQLPSVEERRVLSYDGTELAYHVCGEGAPVLLCNGLGGSWVAWSHQLAYFADRYRFISWDYRGLYRSGRPASEGSLAVECHARDALAVLEAEKIDDVALLGWSMGVQVALEIYRSRPDEVTALTLLNGVSGDLYATVLGQPALDRIIPSALRTLGGVPHMVEGVVKRAVRLPGLVSMAKTLGLAAPTLDDRIFAALAGSFADLDMGIYLRLLEELGEHDATDLLPEVTAPTLVIAGSRDLMTPESAARRMAARIPGAETMIVPGGTHYVAVEYPELVNLRLEKFWRTHGVGDQNR